MFSIGVVTKNRKYHLNRLLNSLIKLNKKDIINEIIIADGSRENSRLTDNEINIISECITGDIIYLVAPGDEATGRNMVVKHSNTNWILFLDDDCIPYSNILEIYYECILNNNNSNIGAIYGLTEFVGKITKSFRACYLTPFIYPFTIALSDDNPDWGPTVCSLFKKEAFNNVYGFDENCPVPVSGTDVDIGIRLNIMGYKTIMCPDAKVMHTTDTWNSFIGNLKRFFVWGRSEVFLVQTHPDRIYKGNYKWFVDIYKGQLNVKSKIKFSILEYMIGYGYLVANTFGYIYQSLIVKNCSLLRKRFVFYYCNYIDLKY